MSGFLTNIDTTHNRIEAARLNYLSSGRQLIDLAESNPTNEGFLFPTEAIEQTCKEYFAARQYTPSAKGLISAREAIAEYYLKRTPTVAVNPAQIFLTASTSESYRILFSLLADAGDNLLASQVNYPLFELLAADSRINLKQFSMAEDNNWLIDSNSICQARDSKTRGILLVSPHNPTGAAHLERVKSIAESKLPIVADEVFAEFSYSIESIPCISTLYPDQPVFMLNGISKMFALPDLKLGWIVLNDAAYEIFGQRLEILNDLYLSANQFSQTLLPKLFGQLEKFKHLYQHQIKKSLNVALDIMSGYKFIHCRQPQGGAFLFPQINSSLDEETLVLQLISRGIYTHPGYFYGDLRNSYLLASCVSTPEVTENNVKQLCFALEQVVS